MKVYMKSLFHGFLLLLVALTVWGGARKFADADGVGRVAIAVSFAASALLVSWLFRSQWQNKADAARAILAGALLVVGFEWAASRADERTDRPDEEIRMAILGNWRLQSRVDGASLGANLPEGVDLVVASVAEVTFEPGVARSKGSHVISATIAGGLEGKFLSEERETWTIEDRRITLTPDPQNSRWWPDPDHAPTRLFRERFPDWPKTGDATPVRYDIKELTSSKLVLVHRKISDAGKKARVELIYDRAIDR